MAASPPSYIVIPIDIEESKRINRMKCKLRALIRDAEEEKMTLIKKLNLGKEAELAFIELLNQKSKKG